MPDEQVSPIRNQEELLERIGKIHLESYLLCKRYFDKYYDNSGNIGVYCHYQDEYELLNEIRTQLTEPSTNPNQRYFKLLQSIIIPAQNDIPETTYQYLYIREPDRTPYGQHTGDVNFCVDEQTLNQLKETLFNNPSTQGVMLYTSKNWESIQISDPNIGAVIYMGTPEMAANVRINSN